MEPHAGYVPIPHFRDRFSRGAANGAPEFTSGYLWGITARAEALDDATRERMIDAYDAEIAAVDTGVGRLLEKLEARGFLSDAVVFVVSDHGDLLTNRHVAEPWDFDDSVDEMIQRGFTPRMRRFLGYLPGVPSPFDVRFVRASSRPRSPLSASS